MKTVLVKIYMLAIVLAFVSSCTRNDGDIGELFGIWRVTAIEVDDANQESYGGTLYFAFQSSVYSQKLVDEGAHVYDNHFASWKYQGKDIIIDFSDDRYTPIAITGMQRGQNLVVVESMKGKDLILAYVNPVGVKYRFILKKW